jgi:NAD(P)-dependent dehydrogenase (short-subunit alcohol dehydrogenase family)
MSAKEKRFPPQQQEQPGVQSKMRPQPETQPPGYRSGRKLEGKKAIVTGGDSGIGRAVAVAFAREGADVSIIYLSEHQDADEARREVEDAGGRALTFSGDVGDEGFCRAAARASIDALGGLDILVNNAAEQHERKSVKEVGYPELDRIFRTNLYSMFFMVNACIDCFKPEGGVIINSASVTAYQGHPTLLDYSSTKGAIVAFTRSLSLHLVERNIRVNAVAPGPVWTPLIPASFDEEKVSSFGANTPMKRAGQPGEIAPCYVFLASSDSRYMTGQVLHPNGGRVVNG